MTPRAPTPGPPDPAGPTQPRDLAAGVRAGNVRALARAITMVERRDPSVRHLLESLAGAAARPVVLGFTGAPGTGKSTLVDSVVARLRGRDLAVAVLAVDPNSPYSGGAILGDRVRMQRHALDPRVYIRSMGARGHLGGLSVASREAIRLLGAAGFDWVILETVGVGQSELEVAAIADTTAVVLTPGLGDGVQMIKAGIMEIADLFAVNKADLPGAAKIVQEVRAMQGMGPRLVWRPPIVATVATSGEGTDELLGAVEEHRRHLEDSGEAVRRAEARLRDEAADLVGEWARAEARHLLDGDAALADRLREEGTPYGTAEEILSRRGVRLIPDAARAEP